MRKQIIMVFIILFSIVIINMAGNNCFSCSPANGAFGVMAKDTVNAGFPALCVPEDVGMRTVILARIDSIVNDGIQAGAFPGCQVLVLKAGKTVYDKCFGYYTYDAVQKVRPTTLYDLASLSKTTGTLLAIMKLVDDGRLKLTDKASRYLAFLQGTDKENITIKELLFHESGLPPTLPFHRLAIKKNNVSPVPATVKSEKSHILEGDKRVVAAAVQYKEGWVSPTPSDEFALKVSDNLYVHQRFHEAAMRMIADTRLLSKGYRYSCVNFILLKEVAEKITGTPLNIFLNHEFYSPLKLNNMTYLPLQTHPREEIAPTLKIDFLRNGKVQGYVHDPEAAFFGGVSGNAGLFATAHDVAIVYQMLLNNGEMAGKRYLGEETCRIFTTTTSSSGRRGLGFDKPVPSKPENNPCCPSAPKAVYGHTGYTGTCCWVDPVNKLIYVFLSNRTYPSDEVNKLAKMNIRTNIQEVIYQSLK